jgi:hypothetical protein
VDVTNLCTAQHHTPMADNDERAATIFYLATQTTLYIRDVAAGDWNRNDNPTMKFNSDFWCVNHGCG